MATIFNGHRWIWRCCRSYNTSRKQFETSKNELITRCRVRTFPGSCVASSMYLFFSSKQNNVSNVEGKMFQELIFKRRRQAHCSLIIEVNSHSSLSHLFKHIDKLAKVKKILWRKLSSKQEYILVECENPSDVKSLLRKCNYSESLDSIPVTSRILKSNIRGNQEESLPIPCEAYDVIGESTINKKLQESENIAEQMKDLQRYEQLLEIDTRLHFFICSQIEDALSGLFPDSVCLPFGSAVNGFGCAFGDLDMNLNLNGRENADDLLLSFIPKRTLACDRFQGQRMLETIGDMLHTFVPGISHLMKILKARIPILKFHHDIVRVHCDLTINNMSGVYMAELLHLYGEMDPCVRPLVHTIRRWARKNELTSDGAGSKITNFSLILMIIFFLQTRINPILPPISRIKYAAETAYENGLQSENLDNFSKTSEEDTTDLESLLLEFFVFCATFKFENAMCIATGTTTPKPDYSSIYIHNPIEKGLNVSKNVTHPELKKVTEAAKLALWEMEKSLNSNDRNKPWGIMKLFSKQKALSSEEVSKRFQISSLFEKKKAGGSSHSVLEKHHHYAQVTDIGSAQAKGKSKLYAQKRKSKT